MFKAIGLNEVSKRVGEEGGGEAPEHPSIGERPAELAKRAVCGLGDGQRESLRPSKSVSVKRERSSVFAVG